MNRRFEVFGSKEGLLRGEYDSLESAWGAIAGMKGRMILWEKWETHPGWVWKQHPLKFIPWRERTLFQVRKWWGRESANWRQILKSWRIGNGK